MAGRKYTKNDLITQVTNNYPNFSEKFGREVTTLNYTQLKRIVDGEDIKVVLGCITTAIYHDQILRIHGETLRILYPKVKLARLSKET